MRVARKPIDENRARPKEVAWRWAVASRINRESYWPEPGRGAWRGVAVLGRGALSVAPVRAFWVQKKIGQSEANLHFRLAKEFSFHFHDVDAA